MPGVDLSKVSSPMSVGNDFLGDITAVTYGDDKDIGRIIITLNDNVDHEVKTGDNSILVSLAKAAVQPAGSVVPASAETAADEPVVEAAAEKPVEVASSAMDESASSAPSEEASTGGRAATMATKVSSSKDGASTVITIATDGVASGYNSFVLSDPARIVVDVPGVMNSTGKDSQKLVGQYVKGVRGHPKEKAAYDRGKKLFYMRAGPYDFACPTCHGVDNQRIRLQDLPNFEKAEPAQRAFSTWPAYRVSQGALRTMQWRINDCFRQQRFPEPIFVSQGTVDLITFLGVKAAGGKMDSPAIKR